MSTIPPQSNITPPPGDAGQSKIAAYAAQVSAGQSLDRPAALDLLQTAGPDLIELFFWADKIRRRFRGPRITLCRIISARTGGCSENCAFCAQSSHHSTALPTAQASTAEIIAAARDALASGAHCFGIVESGRQAQDAEIDRLAPAWEYIARDGRIGCSASLGALTAGQARRLYALGVRRYNHNLESSERFYPNIVSTHPWAERLATVRHAAAAGMKVCCGGIFGLGETDEDRVDLALALRDLPVDSVPLNFLNPIPGTPLAGPVPLRPLQALKILAVFRFLLPDRTLKIAGGRESTLRELQSWIFLAGADSLMVGNYLTTRGRALADDLQLLADLHDSGLQTHPILEQPQPGGC